MKREEILNKAKKENKHSDEWKIDILKNSNIVALILLVTIIGLMLMLSTVQCFSTGTPFANPFIFVFQLASVCAIQSFVKYCYNKKPFEIIVAIIALIGAVCVAVFLM